jgi:hypothetical protein
MNDEMELIIAGPAEISDAAIESLAMLLVEGVCGDNSDAQTETDRPTSPRHTLRGASSIDCRE